MTTPPTAPTTRELAETAMPKMLGAVVAQRRQLQTLAPGVGGPSSMSVTRQIEGLQQVETLLPALALYCRQLEGAVGALGHLSVTSDPAQAAALAGLVAAVHDGLAAVTAELKAGHTDPAAARLLALVQALQTAYAAGVTITDPTVPAAPAATAPTVATPAVTSPTPTVPTAPTGALLTTYAAAWSDGYKAGHPAGYQTGYGAGYQAAYAGAWTAGRGVGWAAAYVVAWRAAVRWAWDDVLARISARL